MLGVFSARNLKLRLKITFSCEDGRRKKEREVKSLHRKVGGKKGGLRGCVCEKLAREIESLHFTH